MIPTFVRKLHQFSRLLVVRVLLIAFLAIVALALAKLFGTMIPKGLSYKVGAEAVDRILSILANSMLTVTTFSLTVMAATHRSVMGLWTPRAHQILLQDTTTHTVLATFVGAYLFALIAITLREASVFDADNMIVLFGMTILVALLVVVAIIRWISHLEMFGSLIETGARIEDATVDAWRLRADWPSLGAVALEDDVPEGVYPVHATTGGYLQQVYQDRLQTAAEDADARIWLPVQVGDFVHRGRPIAWTDRKDDDLADTIRENMSVDTLRNYTQDPGFGLLCLSEIASRALSPGVNDPGTAIDMIARMSRVCLSRDGEHGGEEPKYDRIFVPRLDLDGVLRRSFAPVARDGAAFFEVQSTYRNALRAMSRHDEPRLANAARALLEEAEARAGEVLRPEEMERLRRI